MKKKLLNTIGFALILALTVTLLYLTEQKQKANSVNNTDNIAYQVKSK